MSPGKPQFSAKDGGVSEFLDGGIYVVQRFQLQKSKSIVVFVSCRRGKEFVKISVSSHRTPNILVARFSGKVAHKDDCVGVLMFLRLLTTVQLSSGGELGLCAVAAAACKYVFFFRS